jgi:hypothetical protein
MVFNAILNTVSIISGWSVLLMEEIGVDEENQWPVANCYHIMLYRVHLTMSAEFKLKTLVVVGTDCMVVVNPTTIRSRPRKLF